MSLGVKVTAWEAVPALGAVLGAVKAKLPFTEATPPLNVDDASVCPYVIAVAVGQTLTTGVAWLTKTVVVPFSGV